MLFIASRDLGHSVDDEARLLLLERLQEKGLTPLIRSTRFGCYRQALSGFNSESEMERTIALLTEHEDKTSYIKGDVFFLDDHVLYLTFGEAGGESAGMRAGIVYESDTTEPLRKLDDFCREVSDFLINHGSAGAGLSRTDGARHLALEWRDGRPQEQQGFTRFVAHQDIDSLNTVIRRETAAERARAAELLEDDSSRLFLHRATEAYVEGCAAKLLAGRTSESAGVSIERLLDAGLLRREVLISCRKMGHILFSLPSPDALAVVTVSNATCSACGAAIADEKVEEAVAPTTLASALLEDGSWLVNRLYFRLRELGLPGSEIAIAPPTGNGEAHVMANVCGESFLLVLRDGDLSPAFARRATDAVVKTEATHLMIVVTGKIYEEGHLWLRNYSRRRARRSGTEFELKIAQGVGAAAAELQYSFEQVSQRALAEQLCELDASLGLSMTRIITTRFQLLQRSREANGFARLAIAAPVTKLRPVEPANHFNGFTSDTQLTGSASK
jgi:hypothetical protein